jgi:hypothetical protein
VLNRKSRERKLSGVKWQGALKQKGVKGCLKQGLYTVYQNNEILCFSDEKNVAIQHLLCDLRPNFRNTKQINVKLD